jgi:demethylmenaquinone methyltransferase/2-methoxy-6-polyprenyl-1,4-benzoquinol methylase
MNPAMRDYYEQRSSEYDDWWLGHGRFAQRDRPGWHDDVAALVAVLEALPPARTLDLACGTGFLTRHLPGEITGLDQSEGMIAIASERMPDATFVTGDALHPPRGFERTFTAHFYGHLDEAQRREFLSAVEGELVIVDSASRPELSDEGWDERILNDGSRHEVYKRRFTAAGLAEEIGGAAILHDGPWFVAVQRLDPALRSDAP